MKCHQIACLFFYGDFRVKNHSDELIFHSQGLRRNAANFGIASVKSPSRISPRGLSAKRFDMEEKMNSALEKLLLSELRIVGYEPEPSAEG